MSIPQVFMTIVESIKASMTPGKDQTEDEMLKEGGEHYDQILYFLWACHHEDEKIPSPGLSILEAPETVEWKKTTRESIFPEKASPTVVDLSNSQGPSGLQDGAITAMTKLSDSMIAHQRAAIKNQEEKADSRIKAWRKLPKLQQNVILFGGWGWGRMKMV